MKKHNTYKIKQFQIIQRKVNLIEVLIVIDEKLRNLGISIDKLFEELKKQFNEVLNQDIEIQITEVKEIEKDKRTNEIRVVISEAKNL